VQSLITGERRVLITGGANAVYTSTGHIVFAKLGSLWAAPFDASALALTGPAVPVVKSVVQAAELSGISDNTGAAQFSISDSGTLAYFPGGLLPSDLRTLVWIDRRGNIEPTGMPKGEYWSPRISPDGQRVAVSDQSDNRISLFDLRRRIAQRLPGSGMNVGTWNPEGNRIVFGWVENGARNLFWEPADGSRPAERITTGGSSSMFAALPVMLRRR
jgi:WD40 repeat protein